jgi:hypothetical protein
MVMRYTSIISKSSIDDKVNETIKKDILKEIMMNAISDYLSLMFKEIQEFNTLLQRNRIYSTYTSDDLTFDRAIESILELTFRRIVPKKYTLNNQFFEKEAIDTLLSIINISKPNPRYVDREIKSLMKILQEEGGKVEKLPIYEPPQNSGQNY